MIQSKREQIANKIGPYLPDGVSFKIAALIIDSRVVLRITKPRLTKLGDYRPPYGKETHRISVNGNLNKFSFLVTLLHEFAHLNAWNIQRNLDNPHGKVWKNEFSKLLLEYLAVFPSDIQNELSVYLRNPKASSCSDENLTRILSRYDTKKLLLLEDIPFDVPFVLPGGKRMIKKEKLRKRFKCKELETNRIYLVSPVAEVDII